MIQRPKGTEDIFGKKGNNLAFLISYINSFMPLYNYNYLKTPTFEQSELFYRGVGDTTDIVNKETYDFKDKGGRDMTLRPEMTASAARSLIENKLYTNVSYVEKFYYIGSCFRYERPQSGRLREFQQFGIEAFGCKNPALDAEVISVGYRLLESLGITGMTVKLNTLGDTESRKMHKEALLKHFEKEIDNSETKFYRGNMRSGQKMEFEGSLVILGDVNGGAEVIAGENIVVLGVLRGLAHAGAKGNKKAIIATNRIECPQLRIANIVKEIEKEEIDQEYKYASVNEKNEIVLE